MKQENQSFFTTLITFLLLQIDLSSLAHSKTAQQFREAPKFYNAPDCPAIGNDTLCSPDAVSVAMTLDAAYVRGSMAAVLSVLQHAACPENLFFHFVTSPDDGPALSAAVSAAFPYLDFRTYPFRQSVVVSRLISTSIRPALDCPLNYARTYLADLLPSCVRRAVYLDSDLVLVDDVAILASIQLSGGRILAAPEYCGANFTTYFTPTFWSSPVLSAAFSGRRPCYFNTGVMVVDLEAWRAAEYTRRIEEWMEVQKRMRIYELGSLPPFLLVFAGDIVAVDHRWNQHGLGGDNFRGLCRNLHPGPVSLLHWSGKGKPWVRLDAGRPCPIDALWAPYDLLKPPYSFDS